LRRHNKSTEANSANAQHKSNGFPAVLH